MSDEKEAALDVQPTEPEQRPSDAFKRKPSLLDRLRRRTSHMSSRPPSYRSSSAGPPAYQADGNAKHADDEEPCGMPLSTLRAVLGNPEAAAPVPRTKSKKKGQSDRKEKRRRSSGGGAGAAWHLGREPGSEPRTRPQFNAQGARLSEFGRPGQ